MFFYPSLERCGPPFPDTDAPVLLVDATRAPISFVNPLFIRTGEPYLGALDNKHCCYLASDKDVGGAGRSVLAT